MSDRNEIEDGMGFAGLLPGRYEADREGKLESEVLRLRGMVNVLADELARYTGRTVPDEIKAAQARVQRHCHVNRGDGTDTCKRCGKDLRDEIHFGVTINLGEESDEN